MGTYNIPSISNCVTRLEQYVLDNKDTLSSEGTAVDIHFDGTEYIPTSPEWCHYQVQPVDSKYATIDGHFLSEGVIIFTAYGPNKVKAGKLGDNLVALLGNQKVLSTQATEIFIIDDQGNLVVTDAFDYIVADESALYGETQIEMNNYRALTQGSLDNGTFMYKLMIYYKEYN